jgi:hypothetical protein
MASWLRVVKHMQAQSLEPGLNQKVRRRQQKCQSAYLFGRIHSASIFVHQVLHIDVLHSVCVLEIQDIHLSAQCCGHVSHCTHFMAQKPEPAFCGCCGLQ